MAEEQASRLATAIEAAARLAILEALAEAAGEISRDLAPGSVDARLRGREVEFVVAKPRSDPPPPAVMAETDDASTTRTTLRLPDAVKALAEQEAAAEGISLNTWLVRAITAALDPRRRQRSTQGSSVTGWVR